MIADPSQLDRLLDGLNDAQREAATACLGPVAILAGAGTGKTRVISRRAAYAIASGVVAADQVLVVTFTDKAATEMVERLRGLGLPGVTARTFHAHALSQLAHFWPSRHEGRGLPAVLETKVPILGRLARDLPGGYRFTPAKDLADEIEWAKSRRLRPDAYAAGSGERTPPIPLELFVRVYAGYERAKARAGRLDFDDMLLQTVELLEADDEARHLVQARKSWFSVDEYQDTNPLQERLLELWLGERDDLCVVGDEDQTIYSFTGATSDFLTGFASRHPRARVVTLGENYRSSPQVLELANRLIARTGRTKRLVATKPDGPVPSIRRFPDGDDELEALATDVHRLVAAGGEPGQVAVLTRTNAQLEPVEEALRRAGVAFRVRGSRFWARRDVRSAVELVRRADLPGLGIDLADEVRSLWTAELGYESDAEPEGEEARDRAAALEMLLSILVAQAAADPAIDAAGFIAELDRRARDERAGSTGGVELLTYHRAKGLEWDAVYLPMLEEGSLPIRHAADDPAALAEERRLLYVGITRARVHLWLSWAERRLGPQSREGRRRESRFLGDLRAQRVTSRARHAVRPSVAGDLGPAVARSSAPGLGGGDIDARLLAALRTWRLERSRADAVPAYVVAHDATLEAIAGARPRSLPALRRVRGMGPAKLDHYGEELLAVLARALDGEPR